jgi:putative redox protein
MTLSSLQCQHGWPPRPAAWQVRFLAGANEGRADTVKDGTGGSAGMQPHELLEASLAT